MLSYHNILNTQRFSLEGKKCWSKLVDIIDGDTIEVIMGMEHDYWRFRIRIRGIDTEELRGGSEEERDLAVAAHKRVTELCCGNEIECNRVDIRKYLLEHDIFLWVICGPFDDFGRVIADVFVGDRSLAGILLNEKLARKQF